MTLEEFLSLTARRLPTAAELVEVCDSLGIGFGRTAEGKPVLRHGGGLKEEALALAGILRREPWRTQVIAARGLKAPGPEPAPSPPGGEGAGGGPAPRRLVLIGPAGDVERVLAEFRGGEPKGQDVHAELVRQAEANPGRTVAGEWLGPLGWTRWLECRR